MRFFLGLLTVTLLLAGQTSFASRVGPASHPFIRLIKGIDDDAKAFNELKARYKDRIDERLPFEESSAQKLLLTAGSLLGRSLELLESTQRYKHDYKNGRFLDENTGKPIELPRDFFSFHGRAAETNVRAVFQFIKHYLSRITEGHQRHGSYISHLSEAQSLRSQIADYRHVLNRLRVESLKNKRRLRQSALDSITFSSIAFATLLTLGGPAPEIAVGAQLATLASAPVVWEYLRRVASDIRLQLELTDEIARLRSRKPEIARLKGYLKTAQNAVAFLAKELRPYPPITHGPELIAAFWEGLRSTGAEITGESEIERFTFLDALQSNLFKPKPLCESSLFRPFSEVNPGKFFN